MTDTLKNKRDHALDFLKIIATILIVLHHYERAFGTQFDALNFGTGRFYFGNVVELFFMISGFIAFSSIRRIHDGLSYNSYLYGKALRLFPLTVLSTFVFSAMYIIVWGTEGFSLFKAIVTALCIQRGGPFTEVLVNSHLWYLSVLLICYSFFFIIIRSGQKFGLNWRYGCIFMVVLGASIISASWNIPFCNESAARGYMAFFTGVLLASAIKKHRPGHAAFIVSFLIVAVMVLLIIFRFEIMEYGLSFILIFVVYPSLIVLFETPLIQNALNHRALGTMAQIAFNVYIWHFDFNTFCAVVNDLYKLRINFTTRAAEMVVVLLNIVIGIFSFYFIERPITKLIKKKVA
ncbi:MAG: acyltransferase [Oscillospiraceae bacterium]|nr:acyltransferase [Oscillospiraceae bacterium]